MNEDIKIDGELISSYSRKQLKRMIRTRLSMITGISRIARFMTEEQLKPYVTSANEIDVITDYLKKTKYE